jgi:hemolysin III
LRLKFDRLREPVNGLSHLAAAVFSAIGLVGLLWVGRGSLAKELSLLIYGLSLVMMFSASATYHLVKSSPVVAQRIRKFDHVSIYLLIAGTYTPICLFYFNGFWRWGLLGIIWGMALVGLVVKLFVIRAPRWITAGVYLVMGWMAVLGVGEMLRSMPAGALVWLAAGGLFFTAGAVVYITKKLDFIPGVFGFHEVWHIFVILGCLCHFIVIAVYIAPA